MDGIDNDKPSAERPEGASARPVVRFRKTFHWTGLSAFSKHVIHECGKIFERPPWDDEDWRIKAS